MSTFPSHGRTAKTIRILPKAVEDETSSSIARAESEGMVVPPATTEGPGAASALEGEGSRTAARRYAEGVARSISKGDTEKLAEEALQAGSGPEGAQLILAERAAKQGRSK